MMRDQSRSNGRRHAASMFNRAVAWRQWRAASTQWRMGWHDCMKACYRERMTRTDRERLP
jgi:hypothetical protein